ISNSGVLRITNSTFSHNASATCGGAILSQIGSASSVVLQNTILALNQANPAVDPSLCGNITIGSGDCFGPVTSLDNNLIGDPTGCTITLGSKDLTGDPGLGTFSDNGTPGNGHFPLLSTSRAIDAANDAACPPTDQLGQPRAGHCDIGAIEFQPLKVM